MIGHLRDWLRARKARLDRVRDRGRAILWAGLDAARYHGWSHDGRSDRQRRQRAAALMKASHGIEKGLSLANPRTGFGQAKVLNVMRLVDRGLAEDRPSDVIRSAILGLEAYRDSQRERGLTLGWLDDWLGARQDCLRPRVVGEPAGVRRHGTADGGTVECDRAAIRRATQPVTPDFFRTRHSLRQFGPDRVPDDQIEEAVALAQTAPSACNRQGLRAHVFRDPMTALKHQRGNAGFGHLASHGIVIAADLQAFSSAGERHQAYVDGGIFAMTLVMGLHALGYGSCMLAWNSSPAEEARVRRALGLSDSEAIVMMMAVGTIPERLRVARSWRLPLTEALVWHGQRPSLAARPVPDAIETAGHG